MQGTSWMICKTFLYESKNYFDVTITEGKDFGQKEVTKLNQGILKTQGNLTAYTGSI